MDVALVAGVGEGVDLVPAPCRRPFDLPVDRERPRVGGEIRRHLGGEHRPLRTRVVLTWREPGVALAASLRAKPLVNFAMVPAFVAGIRVRVHRDRTERRRRAPATRQAARSRALARECTRAPPAPRRPRDARAANSAAVTHQRSPGTRPGNPYCGIGVVRSLPIRRWCSRNSDVTTAHTVWLPRSSGPVLQQPSR